MLKRFNPQAVWPTGLLLLSLFVAACGVAPAQPGETAAISTTESEGCVIGSSTSCGDAPTEQADSAITTDLAAEPPAATEEAAAATAAPETASEQNVASAVCEPVNIPINPLIAPVSDQEWSKGPSDAPITLIEYADFQCPGCAGISPVVNQLKAAYGDEMRIVYRHLPLIGLHDKAVIAAEGAEAAGAQDKFWEMHDLLFERQGQWDTKPEAEMIEVLVGYAEEIGVADLEKFQSDLEDHTYNDKVQAAYKSATEAQLSSTPSIFVNQIDYPYQSFGPTYEGMDAFIKLIQLRDKWYTQPEQVIDPEKQYTATIKTEKGDIVIELFADTAPVNVNSFAFLAEQGWYKGVTFHRVLPGFVAQGGDPTGLGIGFPGYRCSDELTTSRTFDEPGLVSLANSGPNTNGSQFFITYAPVPQLNEGFTIIGRVVEGMEIAEGITPRDPQTAPDAPPGDKIIDVTIEEKG